MFQASPPPAPERVVRLSRQLHRPRVPDLPAWLEGDYAVRRRGATVALLHRDLVEPLLRHGVLGAADREPPRTEPGAAASPGRGATWSIPLGGDARALVRPFRRGGLIRHLLRRSYLLGHRAFHELRVTEHLRRRGLRVPRVLAAVESGSGPAYRAALVTLRIPDVRPLSRLLAGAPDAQPVARWLRGAGRAVGRLHAAGGWHADLNAHNLLAGEADEPAVWIVDFDRARLHPGPLPPDRALHNLDRLYRSFRKLGLDASLEGWEELRRAYSRYSGTAAGSDAG